MQNYYPNYYQNQQQMMQQQQMQQMPQVQPKSNRIWVQGAESAKSYNVAPNTVVDLWDSEAQTIYIKSADIYGKPSMQIIDYTIRDGQNAPTTPDFAPRSDFATKDDILSMEDRINQLEGKLERISHRKKNNHNKGGLNHEQSNAND